MELPTFRPGRLWRRLSLALLPLLLVACGGGSGERCDLVGQKNWLREHFNEWYFWYLLAPSPEPGGFATLDDYFTALQYTGTDPNFPADRWSFYESTESFNRFFGDGMTLGYGLFVAGLEVEGLPSAPLYVRYIEPQSDAAAKGLQRGDRVLSINGEPVANFIADQDRFSILSPAQEGETITLVVRGATGGDRTVVLSATIYSLTPVSGSSIVTSPGGRKMGYVVIKDMINQVNTPLQDAFLQFRAQGVNDIVLDLRYNGGGLVSVAANIGSLVGGTRSAGRTFAQLLYNDKRAPINNQTYTFQRPSAALGLPRVYVLAGPRTCSASEQVVNGLRPFVDVVLIGDTTCGKPVGFLPRSQCENTYSIVSFESVNHLNEGRYFDGFEATCPVAEDFTQPLGAVDEPLLRTARLYADANGCPPTPLARERALTRRAPGARTTEAGERQGMVAR